MAAEIISTVERRRRWPAEEKLRIMSEALERGATVAAVADRNGVCRSQFYTWLRLARDDHLPGISITPQPLKSFVPVRIGPLATTAPANGAPACALPDGRPAPSSRRRISVVEVVLGNGRWPTRSTGAARDQGAGRRAHLSGVRRDRHAQWLRGLGARRRWHRPIRAGTFPFRAFDRCWDDDTLWWGSSIEASQGNYSRPGGAAQAPNVSPPLPLRDCQNGNAACLRNTPQARKDLIGGAPPV
jgi:transposase-like protein